MKHLSKMIFYLMLCCINMEYVFAQDFYENSKQQTIDIKAKNLYPEGIAWSHKRNELYISSVRNGSVLICNQNGVIKKVIKNKEIISSVGLLVDDKRDRLWIASSDSGGGEESSPATVNKKAGVAVYDLNSGKIIAYYNLGSLSPGNHLANDLTIDDAGNVYITDSFSPTIWRITPDGKSSIYLKDSKFYVGPGYNLNGIVTLRNNSILVGNSLSGKIFKLSGKNHSNISEVEIDESLKSLDGLRLTDSGDLFVVLNNGKSNGYGEVLKLSSYDDWKTAKIVKRERSISSMPTTAAYMAGSIWVLNAQLDKLLTSVKKPAEIDSFIVQKISTE